MAVKPRPELEPFFRFNDEEFYEAILNMMACGTSGRRIPTLFLERKQGLDGLRCLEAGNTCKFNKAAKN